MRNPKNLNLVFADTSALMDLTKGQEYNDHIVPPSTDTFHAQSIDAIMDRLTRDHTLVITREIFKELFPTEAGRLDMMRDESGKLTIPQHRHKMISHSDALPLYNVFSDYVDSGKLRCYESTDAMIAAGEVDHPKGGIVIVDESTVHRALPEDGQQISARKQDIFQQHVQSLHRDGGRSSRPKPEKDPAYVDRGEDTMFAAAQAINKHAVAKGLPQRFMVLNNDRRLNDAFERHYRGVKPVLMRGYQIPWALTQLNEGRPDDITPVTAAAFHNALDFEYQERDRTLVTDQARGWRSTIAGAEWLKGVETGEQGAAVHR